MRKKNRVSVMILCMLVLLFAGIGIGIHYYHTEKFLSQELQNVETIVLTVPIGRAFTETINERSEIERLYNILSETTNVKNERHPSQDALTEWHREVEVDINYRDGQTDHFFTTGKYGTVYKLSGSKGKPKYLSGENESFWLAVFE